MSKPTRTLQVLKITGITAFLLSLSSGCGPMAGSVPKSSLTPSSQSSKHPHPVLTTGPDGALHGEPGPSHPRQRAIARFKDALQKKEHAEIAAQIRDHEQRGLHPWPDAITTVFIGGTCEGSQAVEQSDGHQVIEPERCSWTYLVSQEYTNRTTYRSVSALVTASTDLSVEPELKVVIPSTLVEQWL